jgi:hypothetical protein
MRQRTRIKKKVIDGYLRVGHLWSRELLLSVIPEVTDNDHDLAHQRDPERHRREWAVLESVPDIPQSEVWEHLLPRDGWPSYDDNDGTQHLGEGESRADVETREGLEENHAQTDTLDSIEDTQPEPQGNADPGSSTSRPWNVQSNRGDTPDHLAPARRTDTNRKDGKEPRVDLTEPGEECEEGSPYTDEEDAKEDEDLPVLEFVVPQEGPVLSVRPAQPVIAQHQREEEPQHELTTEKRVVEVGNLWWRLTVVLCVQS